MELKVELPNNAINEWGDTIETILKDEIRQAIRAEARKAVKGLKTDIEKTINKVFKGSLSEKALEMVCRSVLNDLLKEK